MLIGRPGDEVIRQVGATVRMAGCRPPQVELLERKAAGLADEPGESVAGDRKRVPSDQAGPSCRRSMPRKPLASSRSIRAPRTSSVCSASPHHLPGGVGRVEPVERRLAGLEVVEVDPAAAIRRPLITPVALQSVSLTPVGVDHPLN